jgi:sequestosome 1
LPYILHPLLIFFSLSLQPSEEVPSEFIEQALSQLQSMGYEDEGGWLTELVKAKGGDISKVLDALHPTITETD